MKLRSRVAWVAGVMVLALSTVSTIQAQTVTFSDIRDAVPNKYFDAATTAPDPRTPNRLIIGLHTGIDSTTWTSNTFTAATAAFYRPTAMDTIRFRIEAPAGFYISKISYKQSGTGVVSRTSRVGGGASWIIDDVPRPLGFFGANPTLTRTVNLTGQNKTLVWVSITNSMFAFAPPTLGAATITLQRAEVLVQLLPQ